MKLRDALHGCSTSQLRRIAEAWQAPAEAGTLRHEFADLLCSAIEAGVMADGFVAGLDPMSLAVVTLLSRAHGRHESDLLARRLAPATGAIGDEAWAQIDASIARLVDLGLLFRLFESEGALRRTILVMPEAVRTSIATRLGGAEAPTRPIQPIEPDRIANGEPVHDLFVVASALEREARAASSRGLAGRTPRTVAQVLAALRIQTPEGPGEPARRWQFLLWVGKRVGWFAGDSWPLPDDDTLWQVLGDRDALVRTVLGAMSPQPRSERRAERGPDLAGLHADVLQLLTELEPGAWWPIDDLLAYLGEQLGEDWSAGSAAVSRRGRDAVLRWLTGRWHWLGLVDWGQTPEGWWAVSVSDALLSVATGGSGAAASARACEASEPFHLIAPADADFRALYRAERYLTYRGGDASERRYHLTPASVARGIRLGGDEEEVLASLRRLLQADPPDGWSEAIVGWCRANSALRLEPRVLLVASDEEALNAALTLDDARNAIIQRLSSRHAIVALDRVSTLLTGLASAGQPVEVDASLRIESRRPAQAAALGDGVAEAAWVALDLLGRLAGDALADQRDLVIARRALEGALPAQTLETLERRARTLAALIAERRETRRKPARRRRVV